MILNDLVMFGKLPRSLVLKIIKLFERFGGLKVQVTN